jgi:hypothetical protein
MLAEGYALAMFEDPKLEVVFLNRHVSVEGSVASSRGGRLRVEEAGQ